MNGRLARPEPTDEALAAAVANRDQAAFEALYDRYARRVYVLGVHLLGAADAEEVVQESFVRLWQRAGQFDPARGPFKSWFMAVARHYVLNQLRERSRKDRLQTLDDVDTLLGNAADPSPDVSEQAWLGEQSARALEVLRTLPPEQRKVLVLAYFGGFSQTEIAEALVLPLGTVKTRTRLALEKLRSALVDEEPAKRAEPAPRTSGTGLVQG
ncbi:MAG: sigma-70 family RNA polymerase sigma factor [Chloroflexi bacterium]|nr:sigma-70 family RNA polymerase sigma factor [Chloroflexota bacterium]